MTNILAPRKELVSGKVWVDILLEERQPSCCDFEKLAFLGPDSAQNNRIKKIKGDTFELILSN